MSFSKTVTTFNQHLVDVIVPVPLQQQQKHQRTTTDITGSNGRTERNGTEQNGKCTIKEQKYNIEWHDEWNE